jgi:hypothetical protein
MTFVISTSNAFLWTQLESCVAIICVCLPTVKGLITNILPNLISTKGRSTGNRYDLEIENSWKGRGGGKERDEDSSASQERTIRIKRTVDVEVTSGVPEEVVLGRDVFVGANHV